MDSRTHTQIRTHAQKYFNKLSEGKQLSVLEDGMPQPHENDSPVSKASSKKASPVHIAKKKERSAQIRAAKVRPVLVLGSPEALKKKRSTTPRKPSPTVTSSRLSRERRVPKKFSDAAEHNQITSAIIASCKNLEEKLSVFRGVKWCALSGQWKVQIKFHGQLHHIGYFDEEDEGAHAYDEVAREKEGVCAILNFPSEGISDDWASIDSWEDEDDDDWDEGLSKQEMQDDDQQLLRKAGLQLLRQHKQQDSLLEAAAEESLSSYNDRLMAELENPTLSSPYISPHLSPHDSNHVSPPWPLSPQNCAPVVSMPHQLQRQSTALQVQQMQAALLHEHGRDQQQQHVQFSGNVEHNDHDDQAKPAQATHGQALPIEIRTDDGTSGRTYKYAVGDCVLAKLSQQTLGARIMGVYEDGHHGHLYDIEYENGHTKKRVERSLFVVEIFGQQPCGRPNGSNGSNGSELPAQDALEIQNLQAEMDLKTVHPGKSPRKSLATVAAMKTAAAAVTSNVAATDTANTANAATGYPPAATMVVHGTSSPSLNTGSLFSMEQQQPQSSQPPTSSSSQQQQQPSMQISKQPRQQPAPPEVTPTALSAQPPHPLAQPPQPLSQQLPQNTVPIAEGGVCVHKGSSIPNHAPVHAPTAVGVVAVAGPVGGEIPGQSGQQQDQEQEQEQQQQQEEQQANEHRETPMHRLQKVHSQVQMRLQEHVQSQTQTQSQTQVQGGHEGKKRRGVQDDSATDYTNIFDDPTPEEQQPSSTTSSITQNQSEVSPDGLNHLHTAWAEAHAKAVSESQARKMRQTAKRQGVQQQQQQPQPQPQPQQQQQQEQEEEEGGVHQQAQSQLLQEKEQQRQLALQVQQAQQTWGVGDLVEAEWEWKGRFYGGEIVNVTHNHAAQDPVSGLPAAPDAMFRQYTIRYEDGDLEDNVSPRRIRQRGKRKRKMPSKYDEGTEHGTMHTVQAVAGLSPCGIDPRARQRVDV
jgi:hypothetical protein